MLAKGRLPHWYGSSIAFGRIARHTRSDLELSEFCQASSALFLQFETIRQQQVELLFLFSRSNNPAVL